MADLIYAAIASLDGYVADEGGEFGWAAPDEEVHSYVNALERPIGTYLYGRRMYDIMVFWETEGDGDDEPAVMHEYTEIWRAADKIVFSRTLESPSSARTRIEREFDPVAVRALVDAAPSDMSLGGAELAGQALAAGVVDQVHLILVPVIVGGGTRALPGGVRLDLELVGEHRFASGFVHLHYRTDRDRTPPTDAQ
jgi:dihydrofolate reductase